MTKRQAVGVMLLGWSGVGARDKEGGLPPKAKRARNGFSPRAY